MNNDMLPIDLGKLTDVGQTRDHNEDTIQTWHSAWDDQHGGRLFIVADGVGGESHGDIASQLTVQNTGYLYYEAMRQNPQLPIKNTLMEVIAQVNQVIYQEAERRMSAGHMASTIVAAVLRKTRLTIAWLGDSRAYLVYRNRPGIQQVTLDHSQVEEQFRAGLLTAEQAANHPAKNVLSRSVGGRPMVNVDAVEYEVQSGDILIICSDGLTRHVTDPELEHIARQSPDSQSAANTMIQWANNRGGRDNISAIVVYFGQRGSSTAIFGLNTAPVPQNLGVPFDERDTDPGPGAAIIAQPGDFLDEREASDATYDPAMVLPVAKSVPTNPGLAPQKKSGGSGRIIIGIILLLAVLGGAAFLFSTLGGESAEPTEVAASPTIEASEVILTDTPLPPSPTEPTATPTEDVTILTSTAVAMVISVTEAESERRTAVYGTRAAHDTQTAVPNVGSINAATETASPTQTLDVSTATAAAVIEIQTVIAPTTVSVPTIVIVPTVINNWEAGERLVTTQFTGLSEQPGIAPLTNHLSPATIATVVADPQGRISVIDPTTGETWWHVNIISWGDGWLPESALRLR